MIQKDRKILNLIGIRNNFEYKPYQTPEISAVLVEQKPSGK